MKTDDLIAMLAADAGQVRGQTVGRSMAVALGLGLLASAVLAVLAFGLLPPNAWIASSTLPKLLYAGALAAALVALLLRLGRPAASWRRAAIVAAAVVGVALVVGAVGLASTPTADRLSAVLGGSALVCPAAILLLSLPALGGILAVARGLAPVRPGLAGMVAGLLAGAIGAAGYALTCTEGALPFIATWYTLGILLSGIAGGVFGRRVLAW